MEPKSNPHARRDPWLELADHLDALASKPLAGRRATLRALADFLRRGAA